MLDSSMKREELSSKRDSSWYSPVKSAKFLKHSVSKRELSSAKLINQTVKKSNEVSTIIENSKIMARDSINVLNSPERSAVSYGNSKYKNNLHSEVADETSANFSKNFMDEYYASNGYFSFSANWKQMREKDNLYDRLQTFVDERLLEVAGQISVKQEKEEKKTDNIEYLANLRADIGMQIIISLN